MKHALETTTSAPTFAIVKPVNATPIYRWNPIRGEFVLIRHGIDPDAEVER